MDWLRDYCGWLFIAAALLVSIFGGITLTPQEGTLTSGALVVALIAIGILVDRVTEPGRQARKRDRERAQRLGWAFGEKWPDAPDALVAWVATLDDTKIADLYAWLSIFGQRPGVDALATTRYAPDEVGHILTGLDDDDRMRLQDILKLA